MIPHRDSATSGQHCKQLFDRGGARPSGAVRGDELKRIAEGVRRNPWEARHDARLLRRDDLDPASTIPPAESVNEFGADAAVSVEHQGVVWTHGVDL